MIELVVLLVSAYGAWNLRAALGCSRIRGSLEMPPEVIWKALLSGFGEIVMPTYDYRCKACGHALEVFQNITDRKLVRCPSCAKRALERLIGPGSGIIFQG